MSELKAIKERIFNDNLIKELLTDLGCWNIQNEQKGKLIVAGLPDGDNERSVQIKNSPMLTANIRSKGISGDIYDVISYIVFEAQSDEERVKSLNKSKFWICKKYGYLEYIDEFYKTTLKEQRPKLNKWLTSLKNKRSETPLALENKTIEVSYENQYGILPYLDWFRSGLCISTQKYFQIGLDIRSERVTFPIHNAAGQLIGVKGRYCGQDSKIEEKYKYLYIVPCNKSIELFNYHRALPYIKEKQEVIIVEGAKTTMFLTQWGYKNCVSVEGDSLSDDQINLLKALGLNITYVFAFDKDKPPDFVLAEANKLRGRVKYGAYDTEGLLKDKESPTDQGEEVWNKLYSSKYKIT
ncbi:DNA primase [Bacillus pumilus]|uniref:DNA primase n=1 Tax=Bacillus pumilus TaxID=1408 RepID=UPI002812BAF8|nr:DNA primase [Bacillus pumilus]MDR0123091.1 DNA primase [Bacillus pumilus]